MALKYYKDADLNFRVDTLDLGKLKAGEKKQFIYYIFNDSIYDIEELKFSTEHKDIKILNAPTEMKIKSKAEIVLEWSPAVSIKKGLKTKLSADFYDVVEG